MIFSTSEPRERNLWVIPPKTGCPLGAHSVSIFERRRGYPRPVLRLGNNGGGSSKTKPAMAGARELALRDKHQFRWWAAWRLGARWYHEEKRVRTGAFTGA